MKDQILGKAQRFWKGFLAFTPGQKVVTVAAILALVVGGYVFSTWASKPSYAPLFTNLAPADASAIIDKLNTSKTSYELAANGTEILVPQKDVYALRLTMSAANLPAAGTTNGYSLLDKEGITTSEFKQHVDYQRALEGELSKTISSISGVSSAQVHLAIPEQTVFDDGTQKPTASVLLATTPGTTLSSGQVQSVVNLVASSVPGLTSDQVSVSDSTGKVLSAAGDAGGTSADTDAQTAATVAYEKRLSQQAQDMLDKVLGVGHAVVTVNAALDFNKSNSVITNYSAASGVPPLAMASTGESYGNGATGAAGVVGANTSAPTASSSGSAANSAYSKGSLTQNNAVNSTVETVTNAPGSVTALSVSVLLDKTSTPMTTAQVQSLVGTAVGLNTKRGDTLAVTSAPFDTSAASAAANALAAQNKVEAAAAKSKQMMSLVKTGGAVLGVIALLVITMVASKRRKKPEEPDDLDAFLSALNENPNGLPPAPTEMVPPISREDQLAAGRQRQLAEMADNDPQEVARLLRTWLNAKES
ncbi:MAG: fliF [Frankiales bacterium]|nr:fliF [Frankiales bacterium]